MSVSRPFVLGLLVGRFQMLHLGHQYMIDTALAVCDRVGLLVGSSQESCTATNPFSYELRRDMLRDLYGNRIEIAPLPDIGVGNTSTWGNYVLLKSQEAFGAAPDLVVSGMEGRRISWFHNDSSASGGSSHCVSECLYPQNRFADTSPDGGTLQRANPPAELYLPKTINISASKLRAFLIDDNFAAWSEFTDPRLHARYDELRALVLGSEAHRETASL